MVAQSAHGVGVHRAVEMIETKLLQFGLKVVEVIGVGFNKVLETVGGFFLVLQCDFDIVIHAVVLASSKKAGVVGHGRG